MGRKLLSLLLGMKVASIHIDDLRHSSKQQKQAYGFFVVWQGMRDSNPRMSPPKGDALPLGQSPTLLIGLPVAETI